MQGILLGAQLEILGRLLVVAALEVGESQVIECLSIAVVELDGAFERQYGLIICFHTVQG